MSLPDLSLPDLSLPDLSLPDLCDERPAESERSSDSPRRCFRRSSSEPLSAPVRSRSEPSRPSIEWSLLSYDSRSERSDSRSSPSRLPAGDVSRLRLRSIFATASSGSKPASAKLTATVR